MEANVLEQDFLWARPSIAAVDDELTSALFQLGQVECDVSEICMFASLGWLEKFYSNLTLWVFICQLRGKISDGIPSVWTTKLRLDFTFVDWFVHLGRDKFVQQEEVVPLVGSEIPWESKVEFFIVAHSLLLVARDRDIAALACSALSTFKGFSEGLVTSGDHLMKGKLEAAHFVVSPIVVKVIEIVNIIDINTISFAFFKVILNIKAFHPLRVEIVHNDFSLAKLVPKAPFLFV